MYRVLLYFFYYAINLFAVGSIVELATTLPLMIVIACGLFSIKSKNVVFGDMYWFVGYLFFIIGPIQGLMDGCAISGPLGGYCFDGDTIYGVMYYLTVAYIVLSIFLWRYLTIPLYFPENTVSSLERAKYAFVGFIIALLVYLVLSGGPDILFMSRSERSQVDRSDFALLFYGVMCFSLYVVLYEAKFSFRNYRVILLLLIMIFVCNPMNSPRFVFLATWFPVFMVYNQLSVGYARFYFMLFFILIVVMPVFSIVSRFGFDDGGLSQVSLGSVFRIPYIDVVDMALYAHEYVSSYGHGDGAILLLFTFFIPRSIWTGKPELYSLEMGDYLVYQNLAGTSNLSMNFLMDFYYDLGFWGGLVALVVFSGFLRLLVQRLSRLEYAWLIGIALMGLLPILFRGPFPAIAGMGFSMLIAFVMYSMLAKKYRVKVI